MSQFLTSLGTNLAIVAAFAVVVFVALKVAQSIFGAPSTKASAVEVAARLTSLPAASGSALRRRFARSLTSQFLVMPSGERHALSSLRVRIAPEDADRLAPGGDLDLIGDDAARLYESHARRQGWRVPDSIHVSVETDPVLRPGWIPPARGVSEQAWARIGAVSTTGPVEPRSVEHRAVEPRSVQSRLAAVPAPATLAFDSGVSDDDLPTLNVATGIILRAGHESATLMPGEEVILGRGPQSPLVLDAPAVSTRHLAVRQHAGVWQVMDLGSTNGSTLDGQPLPVQQWRDLGAAAAVTLADVEVSVALESGTVHLGAAGRGQ